MGGCHNYGPFLVPYHNTAPIIQGTQKGATILTNTLMRKDLARTDFMIWVLRFGVPGSLLGCLKEQPSIQVTLG